MRDFTMTERAIIAMVMYHYSIEKKDAIGRLLDGYEKAIARLEEYTIEYYKERNND